MTDRDVRLLAMRPDNTEKAPQFSSVEAFTKNTLEPILHLQHPLIMTLVAYYLRRYTTQYGALPHADKLTFLRNMLRRDSRPQHMLIGVVAGHFTTEEFAFFASHETEVRRHLTERLIKEMQEHAELLSTL